jgi:hypothetical protein
MATYNFDLLKLADDESGDAAVFVVVGKKKTEAAAAKPADAADPAHQPAAQEKPKYSFYAKQQVDGRTYSPARARFSPFCRLYCIMDRPRILWLASCDLVDRDIIKSYCSFIVILSIYLCAVCHLLYNSLQVLGLLLIALVSNSDFVQFNLLYPPCRMQLIMVPFVSTDLRSK